MDTLKNNTINFFFMGIFILTLLILLAFHFRREVFVEMEENNIAKIEIQNFVMYQIGQETTDTVIKGDHATQYKDYEVFDYASLSRSLGNDVIEEVSAKEVYRHQNLYKFLEGVYYQRSDGLTFFSEEGSLDSKSEIFKGKGKFWIQDLKGKVVGQNILYNNKTQDIIAEDISGHYQLKDER